MRRRYLLFAAALVACVFQTAYAGEDMDADRGNPVVAQQGAPFHRGGWGGDPGSRGMMRHGRHGNGPAMPCMRLGPGDDGEGFEHHGGGMDIGMFDPHVLEDLELTAEQQVKILDVATENFRERLQLRWELTAAQDKLRDLREADIADYAAIIAVNEEMGGLRGKLDVAGRKVQEQLDAVLTPEQRGKMEQIREEREDERKSRQGGGRYPERDERHRRNHSGSRRLPPR